MIYEISETIWYHNLQKYLISLYKWFFFRHYNLGRIFVKTFNCSLSLRYTTMQLFPCYFHISLRNTICEYSPISRTDKGQYLVFLLELMHTFVKNISYVVVFSSIWCMFKRSCTLFTRLSRIWPRWPQKAPKNANR